MGWTTVDSRRLGSCPFERGCRYRLCCRKGKAMNRVSRTPRRAFLSTPRGPRNEGPKV